MRPRIAILAALPREIAPLVRDWPGQIISGADGTMIAESEQAIVVTAGMGRGRVELALQLAIERGPLSTVISAGYAGALQPGMVRGAIHWPKKIIDAATGESYTCEEGRGALVTVDRVVRRDEKAAIAVRWEAGLVDMEAAAVARLAILHGLPCRALKIVSDEAEDALPDFNRFVDARGQFREAAFAASLALRPWSIPAAVRMGRASARASQAMARELQTLLEHAK